MKITAFGGTVKVGAVLSFTVIVCVTEAVPHVYVNVHVRVMIRGLAGQPVPPLFVSTAFDVMLPVRQVTVAVSGAAAGTWLRQE